MLGDQSGDLGTAQIIDLIFSLSLIFREMVCTRLLLRSVPAVAESSAGAREESPGFAWAPKTAVARSRHTITTDP